MKKRIFALLLLVALCLSGCSGEKHYSVTYWTLFNTVITVTGRAESQADFDEAAEAIYENLEKYHQLFDIYTDYAGVNNLKTVNDNAGIAPVAVDDAIIDLLLNCREYYETTNGAVNAAMGSVLRLWHDAREAEIAALPDGSALKAAAEHCSWDTVIIDEAAGTVFISDPDQLLDVGAIAKGWAAQKCADAAPEGFLLNVGGNVCATGPKKTDGTPWIVGINDPDGGDYLLTVGLTEGAAVTSGDYQRYYEVDGKIYHHIIAPDTLYPAQYWRSVTVICGDSGLADALSTALFVLPLDEGKALLEQFGAEAMWIDGDGNYHYSDGFESHIQ